MAQFLYSNLRVSGGYTASTCALTALEGCEKTRYQTALVWAGKQPRPNSVMSGTSHDYKSPRVICPCMRVLSLLLGRRKASIPRTFPEPQSIELSIVQWPQCLQLLRLLVYPVIIILSTRIQRVSIYQNHASAYPRRQWTCWAICRLLCSVSRLVVHSIDSDALLILTRPYRDSSPPESSDVRLAAQDQEDRWDTRVIVCIADRLPAPRLYGIWRPLHQAH